NYCEATEEIDDNDVWVEELYNIDQPLTEKWRGRPPKNLVNNAVNQKRKRKRMVSSPPLNFDEAMALKNDIEVFRSSQKNVPIMHTDKGKQKEQILTIDESDDYDEDDVDEIFDEIEYESEELEELEGFSSNCISTYEESVEEIESEEMNKIIEIESLAVCLAVMEEIPTGKTAS
ncbi:15926_t:CDS:2, partial [Racocetra fulgida]